mgnify:CR=1 FL=1
MMTLSILYICSHCSMLQGLSWICSLLEVENPGFAPHMSGDSSTPHNTFLCIWATVHKKILEFCQICTVRLIPISASAQCWCSIVNCPLWSQYYNGPIQNSTRKQWQIYCYQSRTFHSMSLIMYHMMEILVKTLVIHIFASFKLQASTSRPGQFMPVYFVNPIALAFLWLKSFIV